MRGRMTAGFALALTLLMAVVSGGLLWYLRFTEERNADALLRMSAKTVREEAEDEATRRNLQTFLRQESDELRSTGLVVTVSPNAGSQTGGTREIEGSSLTGLRFLRVDIGPSALTLGIPWRRTEERLREQAAALIVLTLFGITAGTAGAWFLVGRTLSPIERLSKQADGATVDALKVHLSAPSSDAEILHLVATLNGLLDRLSQSAAAQSRFYSAASHELRTPLHTLSGHLEVGLSRPRTNSEYREAMEEAYRQTARLSSLVQDLLLLTRLNTMPVSPAVEPIDLADLCERTLFQFSPEIERRRLSVKIASAEEVEIAAAPNHVDMVVRNLLENAVNYTSEHGALSIALDTVPDGVRLEIYNDCPPLRIADFDRLLEPFYRPDAARQSGTGGNGLGLAICSAIARSNHWDLALSTEPQGFRVSVTFPRKERICASKTSFPAP